MVILPGSGPSGPRGESSGACHGVKLDVDLHNEVKSCGYSMKKYKKVDRRRGRDGERERVRKAGKEKRRRDREEGVERGRERR